MVREKILIVDDDEMVRLLLRRCLASWEVVEAVDGVDGLEKAMAVRPALLVVDWMMPRMTGEELCRQVRATRGLEHVPIVMLTAKTEVEDRAASYQSGADHFIAKPFDPEELVAIVARALQRSAPLSYAFPLMRALGDRIELGDLPSVGEAVSLLGEFQQHMLPQEPVRMGSFSAGGNLAPSVLASGDFFDFIPWPDDRCGLIIGDVSGRGLAAAYFMVMVRTALRVLARESLPLTSYADTLNDILVRETPLDWFVTLVYAVADPARRELEYVNAGHCPLIVVPPTGPWQVYRSNGPGMGFFADHHFESDRITLDPGDIVVFVTDGIVDAPRSESLQERYEWITAVTRSNAAAPPHHIARLLVEGARTDAENGHKDDLTALVAKFE